MKLKIATKLTIFPILAPFSIMIFMSVYFYTQNRADLLKNLGLQLETIAKTAVLSIKEKDHKKIVSPKMKNLREFKTIKQLLHKVRIMNSLDIDSIYTFQVMNQKPIKLNFGVMLHKKTFIGHEYEVPPKNKKHFAIVMSGKAVYTSLYEDKHGRWISGLAPIINKKNGKVTGVLEVDYKIGKYLNELQNRFQGVLLVTIFLLLSGIFISVFVGFRLVVPIKAIMHAAHEISRGNYEIKIVAKTNDEINDLIVQFNKMAADLKERFHLLKYIPSHTIKNIKKRLSGIGDAKNISDERSDITIFISDIRKFTPFAEKYPPKEVMEVVNHYLELQTSIIKKHGGSIDKYIGDEVIAFFYDDDKNIQATLAACEIHAKIKEANSKQSDQGKKLEVGIGIDSGFLVMGDLGSAEFMDYTAVGIHMNIASRICSSTEAGEVIISDVVYQDISASKNFDKIKVIPKGKVTYKGLSAPIQVYSVLTMM